MTKLSDLQSILLSSSAARDGGSIHPLPASASRGPGAAKAIGALLRRAFVEERETSDAAQVRCLYPLPGERGLGGSEEDL